MTDSQNSMAFSSSPPPVMGEVQKRAYPNPDRFLLMGKQLVANNYNEHHDEDMTPAVDIDDFHILWFTKVLGSWKSVVASDVIRSLIWMVTYNPSKDEAYVEVFKKLNNIKVSNVGMRDSRR